MTTDAYLFGRAATRSVAVGLFSSEDVSTTRARDVHFVNKRLLADLLEGSVPAAVVLTDVDRAFLNLRGTVRREEASETAPQRGVGDGSPDSVSTR